ncbi:E3 ubiquitin-protein ligase RNF216 [Microdochium nivale]|nr:E3 ubiquitin-protein ligase RNF216 [Microdochium nivale]
MPATMFKFLGRQNSTPSLRPAGPAHKGSSPIPSPTTTNSQAVELASSSDSSRLWPDYISDESQLQPVRPLPAHLADLNGSLGVLAAIFPDVQVEVFREMLSSFSEDSRLALVTDLLLKNPGLYVKGRRIVLGAGAGDAGRTAATMAATATGNTRKHGEGEGARGAEPVLPRNEAFRDDAYKGAVRALATQEFKGLSRSAIQAVLSENNHSYLDARPTLVVLSSKSWKFAISSLFYRRKPVTSTEAKTHPLIIWKPTGVGSIVPTIRTTGNAELDRELYNELIAPIRRQEEVKRETDDHDLALTLHTEEATACGAVYECACCFTESTFEEFTTCNVEGHMICFQCVQHSINEALFGQGWRRSINKETGTLRCPALSSTECEGHVVSDDIFRAVSQQKNGVEIMHKLDQRLADHDLVASGVSLIRCPFCSYAEVDDIYVPVGSRRLKFRSANLPNVILLALLPFCIFPFSYIVLAVVSPIAVFFLSGSARLYIDHHLRLAFSRLQRRRRGLKFRCQNTACSRGSCISCSKAWVDIHVCHEDSLVALRVQVEQAMAMAVKRVCPRCNTSFVKNGGCNKLTCPCGYKMCYVCRKDIGGAEGGYQHFCPHFRPEGDGRECHECNRCNLWEQEDTTAILREAKAEAERKWRATEKRQLSDAEKAYLHDAVSSSSVGGGGGAGSSLQQSLSALSSPATAWELLFPGVRRISSIADFVDIVFEAVFV